MTCLCLLSPKSLYNHLKSTLINIEVAHTLLSLLNLALLKKYIFGDFPKDTLVFKDCHSAFC